MRRLIVTVALLATVVVAVPATADARGRAGIGGSGSGRPSPGDARAWAFKITKDSCRAAAYGGFGVIRTKYGLKLPRGQCAVNSIRIGRCLSVKGRNARRCPAGFTIYTLLRLGKTWRCRNFLYIGYDRVGRISRQRPIRLWKCRELPGGRGPIRARR